MIVYNRIDVDGLRCKVSPYSYELIFQLLKGVGSNVDP